MSDAVAEIADLRALLAARDAELATARAELTGARLLIAQYQAQLAKLRRMQFGRSSETLDAEIRQLELLLEDLEEGEAAHIVPTRLRDAARPERHHPRRRPLPDHLPRETILHPAGDRCPECGGLHFAELGEDVTEILDKVPARLRVIRHVRPKLSCRLCSTILQAPAPDLPVAKGRPGPGLLANVVVSKYLDGLPLYRQSAILAREGIAIERATLADWAEAAKVPAMRSIGGRLLEDGHAAWWLKPLAERIAAHVLGAPVIHTDDTPVAVLAPGRGRTRTGRLWTYLLDERPWCGSSPAKHAHQRAPGSSADQGSDHAPQHVGIDGPLDPQAMPADRRPRPGRINGTGQSERHESGW